MSPVNSINETWTGSAGSPWASPLWSTAAGTTTIQNNVGRLTTPSSAGWSSARVDAVDMVVVGDTNVLVSFKFNTQAAQYIDVAINSDALGTAAAPNNGYFLQIEPSTSSSGNLSLFNRTGGTSSWIAGTGAISLVANTFYKVRLERVGQVIRARVWAATATEPGTWQITYTITGTPKTGKVSLGLQNAATVGVRTVDWDNLVVNEVTVPVITPMPSPTWNDEFTTLSLATETGGGTWRTRGADDRRPLAEGYRDYAGTSWNISPTQHPTRNPFSVSNSVLTITAKRATDDVKATANAAGTPVEWMGGYLVSNPVTGLTWQYGYFEFRARFTNPGRGMFPALWLFSNETNRTDGKQAAEIDIFEVFGEPTGRPWYSSYHNRPTPGVQGTIGEFLEDTADWHRYGLVWTPTELHLYRDGVLKSTLTGTPASWFAGTRLGVRINYAVDPTWQSATFKTTPTDPPVGHEFKMDIDYVRYWATPPSNLSPGVTADPGIPAPTNPPAEPEPTPPTPAPAPTLPSPLPAGATNAQIVESHNNLLSYLKSKGV